MYGKLTRFVGGERCSRFEMKMIHRINGRELMPKKSRSVVGLMYGQHQTRDRAAGATLKSRSIVGSALE